MKVAIIGAGVSGLSAARRCQEYGFQCDVFEMTDQIGGTWAYTDRIGLDEYGYPIHSAMYELLRTNLPKETMQFPGFPMREQESSYISHREVLEYLNSFADHFNLRPHIKINTIVTDVRPTAYSTWLVTYLDKPAKEERTKIYAAVTVCNGHHSLPNTPNIDGSEHFEGTLMHSYHYRTPRTYKGQRVLIVGGGFSGIEIATQLHEEGIYVFLSHHQPQPIPPRLPQKPDIDRIDETGRVIFVDETSDSFDTIIFCTGYFHNYPFLRKSCGIELEDDYVQPLYKHLVNIERPTMAILGLAAVTTYPSFDMQARYFCQLLNGSFSLPSEDAMREHSKKDLKDCLSKGMLKKKSHLVADPYESEYILDLATEAGVPPVPTVIHKMKMASLKNLWEDFYNFKNIKFTVIDDETFEQLLSK